MGDLPCPGCGFTGGFHEQKDGLPVCGHLDVDKAHWEYVGMKRPDHDEYDHLWYQETEPEERVGIVHIVRVKREGKDDG